MPPARVIRLEPDADASAVERALRALGLWARPLKAEGVTRAFLVEPCSRELSAEEIERVQGVAAVLAAPSPHPRVDAHPSRVDVGGIAIGRGLPPVVVAGPCSVESREQIHVAAEALAALGVQALRGGAFKPRTSPYTFRGRGREALVWLREAADAYGLLVVTEAVSEEDVSAVAEVADLVQVGSRSMHHLPLLRRVGRAARPVLLKRGLSATLEEWLLAAEACLDAGAPGVVLCERGVRGFDPSTRNLLDLGAVALLAEVRGLPVMVDPSHAAGRRDLIAPLCRAALAAGAAGLLVEVHPDPGEARSDGPQALLPRELEAILEGIR